MSFSFNKDQKLKKRSSILHLFSKGRRFSYNHFLVFWLPVDAEEGLKTGIGAGSKGLKKAVQRNRCKRLMREAFRLQKQELEKIVLESGAGLHLFIVFSGRELPAYDAVFNDFGAILARVKKGYEEQHKKMA